MNVVVVCQARTTSSRLPGKVLLPLTGEPVLVRQLERMAAVKTPCTVVVAIPTDSDDDPLEALCRAQGVPCYRGHPTDLLDRHLGAARAYEADAVVKIPSDCPLIDPAVIDRVLETYLADPERYDFVSNLHPATWPDGYDVEIMSRACLEEAGREAKKPHEREHTTPFFWDQPDRFRIGNVTPADGRDLSMSHRFTIDYPDDYRFLQAVYDALWTPERPVFSLDDILVLLEARPDIYALNARYAGVNWYRHHLDDLRTVDASQTRHES